MTLPAGLPYRTLCGIWYRRKEIQRRVIHEWLDAVGKSMRGGRT